MDLREYLAILKRRWWAVGIITILALIASLWTVFKGPTSYKAMMRVAVSVPTDLPPAPDRPYYAYDRYYPWLTSEYLADDLKEIIKSDAFARDVALAMGMDPNQEVGRIADVIRTRKTHRILEITVLGPTPEGADAMGKAVVQVLNTRMGQYLAQLSSNQGLVKVIDGPSVSLADAPLSGAANVALRTLVGLFLGLVVAFALDYADTSIRTAAEVERLLGLPVLGEIPADRFLRVGRKGVPIRPGPL